MILRISISGHYSTRYRQMNTSTSFFLFLILQSSFAWIPCHLQKGIRKCQGWFIFASPASIIDVQVAGNSTHNVFGSPRPNAEKKTLLDFAINSDEELKDLDILFYEADKAISTKLAFMVDLDNVSYAIGVPRDYTAAISIANANGTTMFISPEDDEHEELMQLMAVQLVEHVGSDLKLIRTPRVLTISGPLENYTKDWKDSFRPKPFDPDDLIADIGPDGGLQEFHDFLKQELGSTEYENVMTEPPTNLTDDIVNLFNIPGIGSQADDEGVRDMFKSILNDPEGHMDSLPDLYNGEDGVGLKLVSYVLPGGKSYSLVQLLKPYILVAKLSQSDQGPQFDLLSPEESKYIEPRLQDIFQSEFESVGLVAHKANR